MKFQWKKNNNYKPKKFSFYSLCTHTHRKDFLNKTKTKCYQHSSIKIKQKKIKILNFTLIKKQGQKWHKQIWWWWWWWQIDYSIITSGQKWTNFYTIDRIIHTHTHTGIHWIIIIIIIIIGLNKVIGYEKKFFHSFNSTDK